MADRYFSVRAGLKNLNRTISAEKLFRQSGPSLSPRARSADHEVSESSAHQPWQRVLPAGAGVGDRSGDHAASRKPRGVACFEHQLASDSERCDQGSQSRRSCTQISVRPHVNFVPDSPLQTHRDRQPCSPIASASPSLHILRAHSASAPANGAPSHSCCPRCSASPANRDRSGTSTAPAGRCQAPVGADLAGRDFGNHALEAGRAAPPAAGRAAKIVINDLNLRPAERRQAGPHGVLQRALLSRLCST